MSGDDGLVVPEQRGDPKKEPSVLPDDLRERGMVGYSSGWDALLGGRVCL